MAMHYNFVKAVSQLCTLCGSTLLSCPNPNKAISLCFVFVSTSSRKRYVIFLLVEEQFHLCLKTWGLCKILVIFMLPVSFQELRPGIHEANILSKDTKVERVSSQASYSGFVYIYQASFLG